MKKRIIIAALFLLAFSSILAQTYTTIHTKGGQAIEVLICEKLPDDIAQSYNEACLAEFPLATMLSSSTTTYNCHSYAWNLSDGGNLTCWINQLTSTKQPNISKYWTNDYYSETSEAKAVKVFYYQSDHSAIVSPTVSGMYESKWGAWPLMRHAPNYGPYLNMDHRKYYKHEKPSVTTGLINCSNGSGTIPKNTAADYYAQTSMAYSSMDCTIETAKGDDAIAEGYATINSTFSNGVNVTFTRTGIYEMQFKFYNQFNELIGKFNFEPIVTQ